MKFKRMGVINLTPDSFSDGGEVSPESFQRHIANFGPIDLLDVGAESTAPMNAPISADEEWERILPYLPELLKLNIPLSFDTYHPETIRKLTTIWIQEGISLPLTWNDVSGKFDEFVHEFLKMRQDFQYILCHNLAPDRSLTSQHMKYISTAETQEFLQELAQHFSSHAHPQVVLDPTLGFSKSYSQNWYVLEHFSELQRMVRHDKWLIGFSRKSFLRKKYGTEDREMLDLFHAEEVRKLLESTSGEVWIRTHRPELI